MTFPSDGTLLPPPSVAQAPPTPAQSRAARPRRWANRTQAVRVAVGVLVCGFLFDRAAHAGGPGLALSLTVAALAVPVALLATKRTTVVPLVMTAVAFGGVATMRASMWTVIPSVGAACILLTLAAGLAHGGRLFDLGFGDVFRMLGRTVPYGAFALVETIDLVHVVSVGGSRRRVAQLARSLIIAAPVLVVLGALLASGDALFASYLDAGSFEVEQWVVHVVVGAFGAVGAVVVGALTRDPQPAGRPGATHRLRATDTATLLGGLVLLFSMFTATQVGAALAGDDYVLERTGLTYAEYARSGFFQLLAVAVITAVVLVAAPAVTNVTDRARPWLRAQSLVAVVLMLGIVVVAVRRLQLYAEAFGYTMLRATSTAVAVWIGVAFLLIGAHLAGLGKRRSWLPGALVVTALAVLGAANVVNLEAVVVRANIERAAQDLPFDAEYLGGLSADASDAIRQNLDRLDPGDRAALVDAVCASPRWEPNVWGTNTSVRAGDALRADICR